MKCSIYNLHLNYYSSSRISSASSISSFSFYLTTLKKLQKRRLVDSASLPFPPAPAFCCRFKRLIQSGEREAWPSVLFEMLSWFQYNGASSNCRAAPAWWGLATHLCHSGDSGKGRKLAIEFLSYGICITGDTYNIYRFLILAFISMCSTFSMGVKVYNSPPCPHRTLFTFLSLNYHFRNGIQILFFPFFPLISLSLWI